MLFVRLLLSRIGALSVFSDNVPAQAGGATSARQQTGRLPVSLPAQSSHGHRVAGSTQYGTTHTSPARRPPAFTQ